MPGQERDSVWLIEQSDEFQEEAATRESQEVK